MIPDVTRERLEEALAKFDSELRDSDQWKDWEQTASHKYAIELEDRRYPVKQIIAMATGAPVSSFSGGPEANKYVRDRGFEISRLREARADDPDDRPVLSETLEAILARYVEARSGPFKGDHPVAVLVSDTGRALRPSEPVVRRKTLRPRAKIILPNRLFPDLLWEWDGTTGLKRCS